MSARRGLVLGGARVVLSDRVLAPGWVSVAAGRIEAFGDGPPPRAVDFDCDGLWLAPGFVDMHVHGGGGASFDSADPLEIERAAHFHRAHGTTTLVASLVSAPIDALERQVASLSACVAEGIVAGIHLEGPWLSPARRGAHASGYLKPPAADDVQRLLTAGRGTIRLVTLAPELPHALDAVRTVTASGAVAAIGHTDASYAQTRQAIAAGARVATHVFNAMRPLHHREPGPVLAVLEDERLTLEVIADGLHVHDALLRWLIATAGSERVALVTDAISAAGAGDGTYTLGDLQVEVHAGAARLAADPSVLAGSTLTLAEAVSHAVGRLGLSVEAAARMASHTPARALGLSGAGDMRVGGHADLVLLDDRGRLLATMARGDWVGAPPPLARNQLPVAARTPLAKSAAGSRRQLIQQLLDLGHLGAVGRPISAAGGLLGGAQVIARRRGQLRGRLRHARRIGRRRRARRRARPRATRALHPSVPGRAPPAPFPAGRSSPPRRSRPR